MGSASMRTRMSGVFGASGRRQTVVIAGCSLLRFGFLGLLARFLGLLADCCGVGFGGSGRWFRLIVLDLVQSRVDRRVALVHRRVVVYFL